MLAPKKSSARVLRTKALSALKKACIRERLAFICAPQGFGKSSIAYQYADAFIKEHSHSRIFSYNFSDRNFSFFKSQLLKSLKLSKQITKNILILESLPDMDEQELEDFNSLINLLLTNSFTILILIKPHQAYIAATFPSAFILKSEAIICQEDELPYFVDTLALNSTINLTQLSKGIPCLLSALSNLYKSDPMQDEFYKDTLLKFCKSLLAEDKTDEVQDALIQLLLVSSAHLHSLKISKDTLLHLEQYYPIFTYNYYDKIVDALPASMDIIYELFALGYISQAHIQRAALLLFKEASFSRCFQLLGLAKQLDLFNDLLALNPLALINCAPLDLLKQGFSQKYFFAQNENMRLAQLIFFLLNKDMRMIRQCVQMLNIEEIDDYQLVAFYEELRKLSVLISSSESLSFLPILSKPNDDNIYSNFVDVIKTHRSILESLFDGKLFDPLKILISKFNAQKPTNLMEAFMALDAYLVEGLTNSSVKSNQNSSEYYGWAYSYFDEHGYRQFVQYVKASKDIIVRLHGSRKFSTSFDNYLSVAIRRRDDAIGNIFTLFAGLEEFSNKNYLHAQIRFMHVSESLLKAPQSYIYRIAALFEQLCLYQLMSEDEIKDACNALSYDALRPKDMHTVFSYVYLLIKTNEHTQAQKYLQINNSFTRSQEYKNLAILIYTFSDEYKVVLKDYIPAQIRNASKPLMSPETHIEHKLNLIDHPSISHVEEQRKNLDICLLGGFKVYKNKQVISNSAWGKRKPIQLLALLALHLNKEVSRHMLIKELWPNMGLEQAKNNLYTTLTSIRQLIGQEKGGPSYIISSKESLRLDGEYVSSDISRFESLVKVYKISQAEMSGAVSLALASKIDELYSGDLMLVKDDPERSFELKRKRLISDYIDCMVDASQTALRISNYSMALFFAEKAIAKHSFREDACSVFLSALEYNGQRAQAVDYYYQFRKELADEYGLDPSIKLQKQYQKLLEGVNAEEIL